MCRKVTHRNDGQLKAVISIGRTRAAIKAFGRWLLESGIVSHDPTTLVRVGRQNRLQPTYLTDQEIRLLLKTVRAHKGWQAERDLIIFQLFINTGIRLSELVNLDISDVNLLEKRITITVKGGQLATRILNSKIRQILNTYLKRRRKICFNGQALFLSQVGDRISSRQIQRRLKDWTAKAGINKSVHPHTLRHSFASSLYARTNNIIAVQQALGHASITTSQIYTHLSNDSLVEALETL